jgi:hypothetical protein
MAPVSTLDLRHLAPPEPMERILAAVASLAPDDCLEALTPLYPAPLLAILHADGFATQVEPIEDGYRVRIFHADSASDPERTRART